MNITTTWEKASFYADDDEDAIVLIPRIRVSTTTSHEQRMLITILVPSKVSTTLLTARCLIGTGIVADLTMYESNYILTTAPNLTREIFSMFTDCVQDVMQNHNVATTLPDKETEWQTTHNGQQSQLVLDD